MTVQTQARGRSTMRETAALKRGYAYDLLVAGPTLSDSEIGRFIAKKYGKSIAPEAIAQIRKAVAEKVNKSALTTVRRGAGRPRTRGVVAPAGSVAARVANDNGRVAEQPKMAQMSFSEVAPSSTSSPASLLSTFPPPANASAPAPSTTPFEPNATPSRTFDVVLNELLSLIPANVVGVRIDARDAKRPRVQLQQLTTNEFTLDLAHGLVTT